MITIQINELGNNKIGFYCFNQYNQVFGGRQIKDKSQKERYLTLLRRKFMKQGQSVICKDQTYHE